MANIPTQAEYERREFDDAWRQLEDLRRAPLTERKEAQAEVFRAMREYPDVIGERIAWLLDGNYGFGSMMMARDIMAHPRRNREAGLMQLIGAFEWMAPEANTIAAWKKLSSTEKKNLDKIIKRVMKRFEKELKEEG